MSLFFKSFFFKSFFFKSFFLGLLSSWLMVQGFLSNEECHFQCPQENTYPVMKTNFQFSANGCGSGGISVSSEVDFTECCNWHDACYSVCGMKKEACEKRFDKCLKKTCDEQSIITSDSCKGTAQIYLLGVQLLGCDAYKKAQEDSCQCVESELVDQHNKEAVTAFLNKYDPSQDSQYVDRLVEKYKGKMHNLFLKLGKKYPSSLSIELPEENTPPTSDEQLDYNDHKDI